MFVSDETQAEDIEHGGALEAGLELEIAAEHGHADLVGIKGKPRGGGAEITVSGFGGQNSEMAGGAHEHRAGADGKHIAKDTACDRGGAGLAERAILGRARLDAEGDRPVVAQIHETGVVLAGLDENLAEAGAIALLLRSELLEKRLGVLVGAAIRPKGTEDAELGDAGLASELLFDQLELFRQKAVFPYD
jgi:hypothetical protein